MSGAEIATLVIGLLVIVLIVGAILAADADEQTRITTHYRRVSHV